MVVKFGDRNFRLGVTVVDCNDCPQSGNWEVGSAKESRGGLNHCLQLKTTDILHDVLDDPNHQMNGKVHSCPFDFYDIDIYQNQNPQMNKNAFFYYVYSYHAQNDQKNP
ncbi:uncharacterized protein G2W53_020266 [Senna tora]|uniref:Uncharacterized protein n=1 Tax=Senna tora TaxID=362788 RepID=A0A834WND4_9FABA|nr:uncharacterized protein G2W53_020266 [Senna tora]